MLNVCNIFQIAIKTYQSFPFLQDFWFENIQSGNPAALSMNKLEPFLTLNNWSTSHDLKTI
jgi:hypothetical protein